MVNVPDASLAHAVRQELSLFSKAPITQQAIQRLETLIIPNRQITDLTGLEHATGLVRLSLWDNQIKDVSPLAGLTQLQQLHIQANRITDITPLAGLTELRQLHLWGNQIRDISILAGLTKLESLWLAGNPIQDTSPLRTLLELNPNLELDIEIIPHSLMKVSGDGQGGSASTQLAAPLVVSVLDQGNSPLAGVSVSFLVSAGGGMLSSTNADPCTVESSKSSVTATTDAKGRAAIRLTLGSDAGTNTVAATVEGLEPATFTATATEQASPHRLTKVCGDSQEGAASEPLAKPLVVFSVG